MLFFINKILGKWQFPAHFLAFRGLEFPLEPPLLDPFGILLKYLFCLKTPSQSKIKTAHGNGYEMQLQSTIAQYQIDHRTRERITEQYDDKYCH